VALTLHLLGELLIDCNNFAEAEVDLQRALDLRQRKLSTESPLVLHPHPTLPFFLLLFLDPVSVRADASGGSTW
jgi:hypothetical protein